MKILHYAVTITVVLFLEQCDASEWVKYPYDNLMFQFNTEPKTWQEAKTACQANGGLLAEPSCCQIDNFLTEKVKSTDQDWWIGGSDQDKEGQFIWKNSGANVGCYTNWFPGEPNNSDGNQDCMMYWKEGQFKWDDYFCHFKKPYICQKRSV